LLDAPAIVGTDVLLMNEGPDFFIPNHKVVLCWQQTIPIISERICLHLFLRCLFFHGNGIRKMGYRF
jgi:hypothetical protein